MTPAASANGTVPRSFYGPDDVDANAYDERLGDPGVYPFTRGTRASAPSAAGSNAIVRELSGQGAAVDSNRQFKYLLDHGATGLDVIADTPTQTYLDADHPYARHAVGNQGVSLCRAEDYRALYADIPLDRVPVSQSLPPAFGFAGILLAAEEHGFDPALVRGSSVLSPLYCESTGYSSNLGLDLHMRLAVDCIEHAAERMPKYHVFVEDTYFISDGSVEPVDEMALGFLEIKEVVRRVLARGLDIDSFAPRIALLVNCGMDFFQEVAKIRASRRIFARMMREEFGAHDPRSWAVSIAAHTSGATMTSQQLVNNVVRGTSQTLALQMAGVRAMEVSAFDEALRTPSKAAHIVGLRTQQIAQLETGVTDVADPLGGSYYVEALTDRMEADILDRIAAIERLGDVMELASSGHFRGLFEEAMVGRARAVADGTRPVVGVNVHAMPPEEDTLLRDTAEERIEPYYALTDEVRLWREGRAMPAVKTALRRLANVARDHDTNVIPALVDALKADASMGECTGVLREAYGRPFDPLTPRDRRRG